MIVFWLMQHAAAATSPIAVSGELLARSAAASLAFGAAAAALTLALALPLGYLGRAIAAGGSRFSSAPPIWRKERRRSSWLWPSFR